MVDAIRRATNGLSRTALAELTGLAPQTISNIVRRLIDDELVVESGTVTNGRGKPRTILQLRPQSRFAIGVHLDPAVINFVVLDLAGGVVAESHLIPSRLVNPTAILTDIANEIGRLERSYGIDRARIVGVGVAVPGPVELSAGTVVDPPNLVGWHRIPVRDQLADATGHNVVLEKDVTAAAVAEMWVGGPAGIGTFLVVYIGTGIGVGLVWRGEAVRGASGNVGDVGHIVVDSTGPTCTCGQRGCIAVTITAEALVGEARELGLSVHPTNLAVAYAELCELTASNQTAQHIIDRSADRMARAVTVMANLFDVERIVFGGPYWPPIAETYLDRIPRLLGDSLATSQIHSTKVSGSAAGRSLTAIGAASIVFDHAFSPHPSNLMLT